MLPKEDLTVVYSQSFHLKSVTPVSIHGADGKTPELRLASIKGMMRYWYRMVQEDPSKSVQKEGEIFGLAQNNNSKKSKIWLTANVAEETLTPIENYEPYNAFKTNVFEKGVEWKVTLSASKENSEAYEIGISSFLLALFLGGFGVRSRHSMSSFGIKEHEIEDEIEFIRLVKEQIGKISDVQFSFNENSISREGPTPLKGPYWKKSRVFKSKLSDLSDLKVAIGQARDSANTDDILGGSGDGADRYPSPLFTSIYPLANEKYLVVVSEVYPEAFSSPGGNAELYDGAKKAYVEQLQKKL